jgi:3-hydroxyacyl-CoA dehydrogenase
VTFLYFNELDKAAAFYANTVGLAHVCDRLKKFEALTCDRRHEPAPLLAKLAAEGKGFE